MEYAALTTSIMGICERQSQGNLTPMEPRELFFEYFSNKTETKVILQANSKQGF